jgi:hypothetical protein
MPITIEHTMLIGSQHLPTELKEFSRNSFCMFANDVRGAGTMYESSYEEIQMRNNAFTPSSKIILFKTHSNFGPTWGLPAEIRREGSNIIRTCLLGIEAKDYRILEDGSITRIPESAFEKLEVIKSVIKIDDGMVSDNKKGRRNTSSVGLGIIQDVCLLDETHGAYVKKAIEELDQRKFSCIKYKGFHRSTSGPEFIKQTKKQIFSGSRFFLFKHTVEILNQKTLEFEDKEMVSLGIFCPLRKVERYTASKNTLEKLYSALNSDGLKLFNSAEHFRKINGKVGRLIKYFPGIAEEIFENMGDSNVPDSLWDVLSTIDEHPSKPTNRELLALSSRNITNHSEIGKRYEKSKDAHGRILKQITNINAEISNLDYENECCLRSKTRAQADIELWKSQIEYKEKEIIGCDEVINNYANATEAQRTQLELVAPAATALELQALRDKAIWEREIVSLIENPKEDAPDLVQRYKETGFIIKEIIYTNRNDTNETKSLHSDPMLPHNEEYFISRITLVTTKPSVIYVNRDTNGNASKKVVGGPYEIEASSISRGGYPSVRLRMANIQSVFGIAPPTSSGQMLVKRHPHTEDYRLRPDVDSLELFASTWVPVCLGDAQATIGKGFREQDPRIVIMGILAWITNANGRDVWGQTWKWFPTLSEVNLEGNYGKLTEDKEEVLEVTDSTAMATAVQELATTLATLQTEEFINQTQTTEGSS